MEEELDFRKMPKWMPEALSIMAMIETWARGYGVQREAIVSQIPTAYAWCESNKKRAPKKHVLRFLFSWMKQAKLYGNLKAQQKVVKRVEEVSVEDMSFDEMVAIRKANMGRGRP